MDLELLLGIFPQVLIDGITLGFMYALIALGYTMVYGVLEFINFAHSEIFIVGAFVGVELLLGMKASGWLDTLPWVVVLLLILAAGMAVSGVLAVIVERTAYRPLRHAPRLIPLISAIGVSFFLQDLIRLVESLWRNAFNLVYPTMDALNRRFDITPTIDVSVKSLVVIVAALLMLWGLYSLVNKTKIGKAIRAVAEDQPAASLMGINVNRMISLTFLIGGAMGGGAGILLGLPVLRLHGDYLALVTLGFGEVIRVLANNLDKPINITNGPKGITPIGRPPIFFAPLLRAIGIEPNPNVIYPLYLYALVLLIVGVTILVNRRLEDSHIGRAWEAIREDQTAAQAMGVPLVRMKLLAFACGASFAGAVGVLFSAKQIFINPESFTFMESIGVLSMIILGGMGSIPGAILGAAVVTVLNLQVLKGFSLWLNELRNAGTVILGYNLANLPTQLEPAKYERMVFGLILVLMMIFRPQGILPARRRTRELGEP